MLHTIVHIATFSASFLTLGLLIFAQFQIKRLRREREAAIARVMAYVDQKVREVIQSRSA